MDAHILSELSRVVNIIILLHLVLEESALLSWDPGMIHVFLDICVHPKQTEAHYGFGGKVW